MLICENVITHIYIQDGLVCVFDLATLQEEDALLAVKNSNASVVTDSNKIIVAQYLELKVNIVG